MPELDDLNDDDDSEQSEQNPKWRRELEKRAKAGDAAVKELETFKRREAFRQAGLDPEDKKVSYFVRGYDGELTKDAITEEATAAGLLAPADDGDGKSAQGEPEQNPAAATLDKIGEAASQGAPLAPDAKQDLEKAYEQGGSDGLMDALEKLGVQISTRQ
jgi:ribosomal protein L12E/L44/L45/RPP1/RPP2